MAIRCRRPLEACEAERRGNREHVLKAPAEMAALLRRPARGRAPRPCASPSAASSTSPATSATATRPTATSGRPRSSRRVCAHPLDERYRRHVPHRARRRGAARGGARADRPPPARRLLPAAPRDPRAGARGRRSRCAGRARRATVLPPGRGRGSSVGSIVCYLTGPLARRPGRRRGSRSAASSTSELASRARHRPRLPARRPRAADRARCTSATAASARRWSPPSPPTASRGAIRELGKALGLPAGRPRPAGARLRRLVRRRTSATSCASLPGVAERARRPALPARLASSPAEIAGLPRHLSQHSGGMVVSDRPARSSSCRCVPAAMEGRQHLPVGQGLVRRRRLPEDRPARAGHALGGRGVRRPRSPGTTRRDGRPLAHPARRPRGLRRDPGRRHRRRLPDRVAGPDADAAADAAPRASTTSRSRSRSCAPGRSRAARCTPTCSAAQAPRDDPASRCPTTTRCWSEALRDTLGVIVFQDQVLDVAHGAGRLHRRAGRGAAAGDEPPALARGDGGALARRSATARASAACTTRPSRTGLRASSSASRPSASPRRTPPPSGCSPTRARGCGSHYPAEFLGALLNAQPMGFYPPATLVRDAAAARRRGARRPTCNARQADRARGRRRRAARPRLRARGCGEDAAERLVAEREAARALPRRRRPRRPASTCAATGSSSWSRPGACDAMAARGGRCSGSSALLARSAPARRRHPARARPPARRARRPLPELGRWDRSWPTTRTTGLSVRRAPVAQLRPGLPPAVRHHRRPATSCPTGTTSALAGLAVARQRPASAKGIVFLLLEDESGMVNLILFPEVYERSACSPAPSRCS